MTRVSFAFIADRSHLCCSPGCDDQPLHKPTLASCLAGILAPCRNHLDKAPEYPSARPYSAQHPPPRPTTAFSLVQSPKSWPSSIGEWQKSVFVLLGSQGFIQFGVCLGTTPLSGGKTPPDLGSLKMALDSLSSGLPQLNSPESPSDHSPW